MLYQFEISHYQQFNPSAQIFPSLLFSEETAVFTFFFFFFEVACKRLNTLVLLLPDDQLQVLVWWCFLCICCKCSFYVSSMDFVFLYLFLDAKLLQTHSTCLKVRNLSLSKYCIYIYICVGYVLMSFFQHSRHLCLRNKVEFWDVSL